TTVGETSAADGSFTLSLTPGVWTIVARKSGYADSVPEVVTVSTRDEVLPAPLRLTPLFRVDGQVRSSVDGAPLAGIRIEAAPGGEATNTDAAGAYSLLLPAGAHDLTASGIGWTTATQSITLSTDTTVDFVLDPAPIIWTLSGLVLDDASGQPVDGASVAIEPGGHRLSTDASGAFSIALEQAVYTVDVRAPGYTPVQDTVTLSADLFHEVRLAPAAASWTLSGVVRRSGGLPLPGATVVVVPGRYEVGTDGAGAYTLVLPEGTYQVTASADGYLPASASVDLMADRSLDLELSPVPPSVTVSGRVVSSADASPIAGATVSLDDGAGAFHSAVSDATGGFTLEGVPPNSSWVLKASAEGFALHSEMLSVQAADISGLEIRLDPLAPTYHVTGSVVRASDSAPLPGAVVAIDALDLSTLTGEDGTFVLEPVPDGTYTVQAGASGYASSTATVTVAGGDASVDFVLTSAGGSFTVEGVVTDAESGTAIEGAGITLSGAVEYAGSSGPDGAFRLVGVASGSYRLAASASGYRPTTVEGVEVDRDLVLDLQLDPDPEARFQLTGTVALQSHPESDWPGSTVTLTGPVEDTTLTGTQGTYRFENLPRGLYLVEVTREGFVPAEATLRIDGETVQDFVLVEATTPPAETPGCGCTSGGGRGVAWIPLLLGAVVWRRRRVQPRARRSDAA
ncbi:MAG: hypothetical protein D6729_14655, partial [Deltaproteobacteria bacterium]